MSQPFDIFSIPSQGVQLIEASAGTGKTYSISSLYLRLLLEKKLRVEEILVVTFTEAATAELHERIRSRLRLAADGFENNRDNNDPVIKELLASSCDYKADLMRLKLAVCEIDQASVSTIHGFCRRILKQNAFESGISFDLELIADTSDLLTEIVNDFWVSKSCELNNKQFALLQSQIGHDELSSLMGLAVKHRDFPLFSVSGSADLNQAFELFTSSYASVHEIWQADKDTIVDEIMSCDGFKAEVRKDLAQGLLNRLEGYLVMPEPSSYIIPQGCNCFSQAKLQDPDGGVCTKKAIKSGVIPQHTFFAAWENLVTQAEWLKQASAKNIMAEAVLFARLQITKRLNEQNLQSFDDLLYGLDRALKSSSGARLLRLIRRQFPVALIDEFQDTDPVQYRIFSSIYRDQPSLGLYLIGDPKQAIYGFRGADIYAYLGAAQMVGDAAYTMSINWRADNMMVQAVNELFSFTEGQGPFFDERIAYHPISARPEARDNWHSPQLGQAPLQFINISDQFPLTRERHPKKDFEDALPRLVAEDISGLLASDACIADKQVVPGDIAVLVRTNEQALAIQDALRRCRIHSVLKSKASVFSSKEALDLYRLFAAVADPASDSKLRVALVTDVLGLTANSLADLNEDERLWQEQVSRFQFWRDTWLTHGIMQMIRVIFEEYNVPARIIEFDNGERRLTNLRHIAELMQDKGQEQHLSPVRQVAWLYKQIERKSKGQEAELRLESDEQAVQLVTVHKSKGLEYPIVYCPYLCMGKNPARQKKFTSLHDPLDNWQGKVVLFPEQEQLAQDQQQEFAENLRLLYVAVTRAKHCCKILWAAPKGYENSALAYLLHAPSSPAAAQESLHTFTTYLRGVSFNALSQELRDKSAVSSSWVIRDLLPASSQPRIETGITVTELSCRQVSHRLDQSWRMSSFSQLSQHGSSATIFGSRDYDAFSSEQVEKTTGSDLPLADFPKGAVAGNFFHMIFELADFAALSAPNDLEDLVARELQNYGFLKEKWTHTVSTSLWQVMKTNLLGKQKLTLSDIPLSQRLNELPFTFPVAGQGNSEPVFTAKALSEAFKEDAGVMSGQYVAEIAHLSFAPLQGYLKGFIDLVFEHNGKWYLADYKSNHLGEHREDYNPGQLVSAMEQHHYFLQYHIYTIALHRYLTHRVPGYSYKKDFGGVFYLFIKGMHPDSGSDYGVFFDLPPLKRVERLSNLFAQTGGDVR